jgi:homoserine dehydrogenase
VEVSEKIIVLKFGSSVLRNSADLPNAVHEIYRWVRSGFQVITVVSAIGDATDRLLADARALSGVPEPFATAELLATGERASAALIGIALDQAGVVARVLNPREIGLTVAGSPLDSELVSVDVSHLHRLFTDYSVLVVPGFFGTDAAGRTHLLGRGGSDLSAVFLAHKLNARCRLIKDVDGVYESDPSCVDAHPRRFIRLDYRDALRVAGQLIQPKAVTFLREQENCAEVAALARPYASTVHPGPTHLTTPNVAIGQAKPLKVLLLGLGTVGFGVYQRLKANADFFEIVACVVRGRGKYRRLGVPDGLLQTDLEQVLDLRPDIVVDALTVAEPSRQLVDHFLQARCQVVSANKALIADHGVVLTALARSTGSRLLYSAAVGGATPVIELVDRVAAQGPITTIVAVLNGTCNVVLDACAEGSPLDYSVREAQAQGFAESDATDDLSGRDAARKLRIVSRHAFGVEPVTIEVQILDDGVARRATEVSAMGKRLRQIARATCESGRVRAQVTFEVVDAHSQFGKLSREWNAVEVIDTSGKAHSAAGRGAGRWPTTEAILADLFSLYRTTGPNSGSDRQNTGAI